MAQEDALRAGETLEGETPNESLYRIAVELAREATRDTAEMVETILELRRKLRDSEVAVPDDLNRIIEMMQRIDTRLALVERDREDAVPGPRVKLFVAEVISPIKDSVHEIKTAMRTLTDESKELYEAHKAFINAEQKRKDKEAEERTPMGMVKKYLPLVTLIGGLIVIFRVLGTAVEVYIQARGGK